MLNKKELVEVTYDLFRGRYPKRDIDKYIDIIFEGVKEAMLYHDGVKVQNFGAFYLHEYSKSVRNSFTGNGTSQSITGRKGPKFKASKIFKAEANDGINNIVSDKESHYEI